MFVVVVPVVVVVVVVGARGYITSIWKGKTEKKEKKTRRQKRKQNEEGQKRKKKVILSAACTVTDCHCACLSEKCKEKKGWLWFELASRQISRSHVSRQSVGSSTSYREILLPRGNAGKVVSTGKTDR